MNMYFVAHDRPSGERLYVLLDETTIYGVMCEICGKHTIFSEYEQFAEAIEETGICGTSHYCFNCQIHRV